MKKIIAVLSVMALLSSANITAFATEAAEASKAGLCDIPYNYLRATVIGECQVPAAKLPATIPVEVFDIEILDNHVVPEVFWYNNKFRFSVAYQDKPAPLVFNIAGTGARFNSAKMVTVQKALHEAGYHVINISSPTFSNFIINGLDPKAHMPGYLEKDAEQLYVAMNKTLAHAKKELDIQVTSFNLTGYSLGGAHSAFVAKLDKERGTFNFEKVLLINPPKNLYNSVKILDGYLDISDKNKLVSVQNQTQDILSRLKHAYSHADNVNFHGDGLYTLAKDAQLTDEELKQLIGISFRLSSADMLFAIDAMYNVGAITYKNHTISKFETMLPVMQRAAMIGFELYFEKGMLPYYKESEPDITKEIMINRLGLGNIESYLSSAKNVYLVTNEDDLILKEGEVDYFREIFGERATIFEQGGHCGNMDRQYFIDHMLTVFQPVNG